MLAAYEQQEVFTLVLTVKQRQRSSYDRLLTIELDGCLDSSFDRKINGDLGV